MSTTNKEKEYHTIQQILHKNKFQTRHLDNIVSKKNITSRIQQTDEVHNTHTPIKWATFTYTGKQTKNITKLFKNMNLKIAFHTKNKLEHLLTQQHNSHHYTNQNKFQKVVYTNWFAKTVTGNIPDRPAVPFIRDSKSISWITNIKMENPILHSTSLIKTIRSGPWKRS